MDLLFQHLCKRARSLTPSNDYDVRNFAIEGIPLRVEFPDAATRIANLKQRPALVVTRPFPKDLRRHTEIDHDSAACETAAVFRVHNDPTPGRQDQPLFARKLLNYLGFPPPETSLAFNLENDRNADSGAGFDLMIGVEESFFQTPRQMSAYGRFPGAHHPDQVDIVATFHGHDSISPCHEKWPDGPAILRKSGFSQRRVSESVTIFGDMKISSSFLLSLLSVFLKRKPM